MNALYLIGSAQSLFFIVLILSKKKLQLKDIILSLYILLLGLNLLFISWQLSGFLNKHPYLILLDFAYWTILGPLLFFYIDITTSENQKFKRKYLIHLLPFLLVCICFSDFIFSGMKENFMFYKKNSLFFFLGYMIWMYNSPIYYIIMIFKLKSHQKRIKTYYASPKDVDLKWLRYLVHGFAVFLFFLLFKGFMFRILKIELPLNNYQYTWLVMVIYIFGIGYFGNKQKGIFTDYEMLVQNQNLLSKDSLLKENKEQYQKTGLRDDEVKIIQDRLETIMNVDKPYLEYEITLPKLANIINTTPHKLSQIINEKYNSNFFEFINRYRLSDLKRLLKNPDNADIKIMTLAYDCGFNSKSAFYSFFKKETSLTPIEYRNKYLELVDG